MSRQSHKKKGSPDLLKKEAAGLKGRIRRMPDILKGSLAEVLLTCGKSGCRCQEGRRHRHRAYRFCYRVAGRTRSVSVPKAWVEEARKRHAAWLRLKSWLEELTHLEIQRFQADPKRQKTTKSRKNPK